MTSNQDIIKGLHFRGKCRGDWGISHHMTGEPSRKNNTRHVHTSVMISPVDQLSYFPNILSQHISKILLLPYPLLVPDQSTLANSSMALLLPPERPSLSFLPSLIKLKDSL